MQKHSAAPAIKDRQGVGCHGGLARRRAAHDTAMLRRAVSDRERLRQTLRWRKLQNAVQVEKLPAVEAVELQHRLRGVVVPVPPEPVGALTQGQLAFGSDALRAPGLAVKCGTVEGALGLAQ